MNRKELLAVGVGLVLIFGVAGVASVTESVSITERPYESKGNATGQRDSGTMNATVSVMRAMQMAQNETDGIAVETRLRQERNVSGSERPVQIYEVMVLNGSGSPTIVDVSAANGTILRRYPAESRSDDWRSLLENQSSGETPNQRLNLDAIRSGQEAVQLARSEGNANMTVTEVVLGSRNGTVVYNVRMVTKTGARSTVVVAAYPDEGGVLSTAAAETSTPTG